MNEELFHELELACSKDDALALSILLDENPPLPDFCGYYEVLYEDKSGRSEPNFAPGEPNVALGEPNVALGEPNVAPGEPNFVPGERNVARDEPNVARDEPGDRTKLVLYFAAENPDAADNLHILLAARGVTEYDLREKTLNRNDYLEAYKEHYRPFPIGRRLVIVPSWHRDSPEGRNYPDRIPLYLDPGLAFGTGQHPTTRLCLGRLEELPPGLRLIDAGCGSGILSIGAALLGASEVLAFDVDNNAVKATLQNSLLNPGIAGRLQARQGGFDLQEFEQEADMLIGNLTEVVILANEARIRRGRFGRMMLSGLLSEQKEKMIERFQDEWRLVLERDDEGWALLEFARA